MFSSSRSRKRTNKLPWMKILLGAVVLVLISAALTAGKYLSQRSTESRSQAAGKQWLCRTFIYSDTDCTNNDNIIYRGPQTITISESNPTIDCRQTSNNPIRATWYFCWENVSNDGNSGPCRPSYASFCQDPNANRTNSYLCKCVALSGGSNSTPVTYGWNCATEDPIKCPVQGSSNGGSGSNTGTNPAPLPPNGGGTSGVGGGTNGSGGTGTGGGGSNPWGARSISGKVVCRVNNQPVANVPVAAYVGTNSGPGNVIKSGKTAGNGQYTLALDGQNERFTVRVMAGGENTKEHDYAFKRSGNPGITCVDSHAFELCRYLEIPVGTTKASFDFATAAQATNLQGSQQVGNVFVFQFNQARDVRGGYLKNYVVRLDNKADGWYNSNSDYYVRVPKEGANGVGTCSGGVCRITSTELNAIRPFKFGTYSMGVNPISNHQVSGQPIIELCRADATVTAAITNTPTSVPSCGNGYTCRAKSAGAPTGNPFLCSTNYQGTYAEWYCCPVKGQVIVNGQCRTITPPTP